MTQLPLPIFPAKGSRVRVPAEGGGYHVTWTMGEAQTFGVPGDKLRCKETWSVSLHFDGHMPSHIPHGVNTHYAATEELDGLLWRSPATMPSWASRITMEAVGVRCVMVQELCSGKGFESMAKETWDDKYAKHGFAWDSNPWAWAVGVRRVGI